MIRNVDETGNLVKVSSKATYIRNRIPMWVFLKLVIFKNPNTNELYPAYQCNTCEEMKAVCSMSYEQDPDEIEALKCHHSMVCDILVGDSWQNTWDLDLTELQNRNESNEVLLHEEIEGVVFRSNNLFLGMIIWLILCRPPSGLAVSIICVCASFSFLMLSNSTFIIV